MILHPLLPIPALIAIALALIGFIVFTIVNKRIRRLNLRQIAILVLLFVVLLRPMIAGGTAVQQSSDVNVFFAIDLTTSMAAKDCDGATTRRFEKMGQDMKKIIEKFPGARFGVFSVDYAIHPSLPLTDDTSTLMSNIESMSTTNENYSSGTDLAEFINRALDNVAKYYQNNPERKNIVFIMTDGEDTELNKISITNAHKQAIADGRVYGYGSREGTYIPTRNYSFGDDSGEIYNDNSFVTDGMRRPHLSSLDEKTLNSLASQLGVSYVNRSEGELEDDSINAIVQSVAMDDSGVVSSYTDIYWIIALAILGLLLWDFKSCLDSVLDERKTVKK